MLAVDIDELGGDILKDSVGNTRTIDPCYRLAAVIDGPADNKHAVIVIYSVIGKYLPEFFVTQIRAVENSFGKSRRASCPD